MDCEDDTAEHHKRRSEFIRSFVQRQFRAAPLSDARVRQIPREIVQFWHARDNVPPDVMACMESWKRLVHQDFKYTLFDRHTARDFVIHELGQRYASAFDLCYHPAMQSDYFRLCFILTNGGMYVDADDVYAGGDIDLMFTDGRLKVQPLCYDIASASMVPPSLFSNANHHSPDWIYYLNNNPLIAPSHHPVITSALEAATSLLEQSEGGYIPEIQSTTGPGNLTKTVFCLTQRSCNIDETVRVLWDWESIGTTKWDLSYRNDSRNWRLSNQQHRDVE